MKLSLLIFLFLISCSPYLFDINRNGNEIINGKITGNFRNFRQINDNSFVLTDSLIIDLKAFNVTNYKAKFLVRFLENNILKLSLRTTLFDYLKGKEGISIYINNNKFKILENSQLIKEGKFDINNSSIIFDIINFGEKLNIKLNCTDINFENIKLPNTEFIIFETNMNSKIEVSGVNYVNLKKNL